MIETLSVDDIVNAVSGQSILTRMISPSEFRAIAQNLRRNIALSTL